MSQPRPQSAARTTPPAAKGAGPASADRPPAAAAHPAPQASPAAGDAAMTESACASETPTCPVCRMPGVEKLQKWFCRRCGRLLQTCCD